MALVVGDFLVAYLGRDDVWFVSGGLLPLLEYLALPLLVTLAVEIGVWLVLHLVHWWHRLVRLQTVLCAVWCVRYLVLNGVCVLELLLQEVPCLCPWLEIERVGEEVVWRCVLIHTSDEV